jgi:hypothetical protein
LLALSLLTGCSSPPSARPIDKNPATRKLSDGVYEIGVDSRAGWVSTTVDLKKGQTLKCRADGYWSESPGKKRTADGGQSGTVLSRTNWAEKLIVPEQNRSGALVGRIGDGKPFTIGAFFTSTKVENPGLLKLSINDNPAKLQDNHGIIRVRIEVTD